jgi:hypothetical protein
MADTPDSKPQQKVNLNPESTPVLYTDSIFMTSNEFGIVIDFGQKLGPTDETRIVSRVGMSREHAKKFLGELGRMLAMTDGSTNTDRN